VKAIPFKMNPASSGYSLSIFLALSSIDLFLDINLQVNFIFIIDVELCPLVALFGLIPQRCPYHLHNQML